MNRNGSTSSDIVLVVRVLFPGIGLGDTVNIASRIVHRADLSSVLASATLWRKFGLGQEVSRAPARRPLTYRVSEGRGPPCRFLGDGVKSGTSLRFQPLYVKQPT